MFSAASPGIGEARDQILRLHPADGYQQEAPAQVGDVGRWSLTVFGEIVGAVS